jgi:hypothetical protein
VNSKGRQLSDFVILFIEEVSVFRLDLAII